MVAAPLPARRAHSVIASERPDASSPPTLPATARASWARGLPRARVSWLPAAAGLATLLALALLLYRPWHALPFESQDFAEFLPLLRAGGSFGERHRVLTDSYASQGRYLPLTLLYTNLKWTMFGFQVAAWQWLNFALMSGVTALAYGFLRRLGASRAGATAGAALYVIGCASSALWPRVHYSEPQGIPFLIGASAGAAGFGSGARWPRRALVVAALMVAAILVKETFVAALPFVLLLAACHDPHDRGWRGPRLDRRLFGFAVVVAVACAVALVPILRVKLQAPPTAFTGEYRVDGLDARRVVVSARNMFLPMTDSVRRPIPELAFVALTTLGLVVGARRGWLAGARWLLLTALALPLGGTLVHLPWPSQAPRYASTSVLGIAILLALSVTSAMRASRGLRLVAATLLLALGAYGTFRSHEETVNFASSRVADMEVARGVTDLGARSAAVSVVVVDDQRGEVSCRTCWLVDRFAPAVLPEAPPASRRVDCADAPEAIRGTQAPLLLAADPRTCAPIAGRLGAPARIAVHVQRHRFSGRPGPPDSTITAIWLLGARDRAAR